ncbi:hypothetical protein HK102_004404 [Quaeritorhiza haematococci]|nr:hypothetical protein HK102_004404 [Quaeritorhiza haematococci]
MAHAAVAAESSRSLSETNPQTYITSAACDIDTADRHARSLGGPVHEHVYHDFKGMEASDLPEFRTPLHGVVGAADLLSRTSLTNEQRGFVDDLQGCGQRLLDFVNDLFAFRKWQFEENQRTTIATLTASAPPASLVTLPVDPDLGSCFLLDHFDHNLDIPETPVPADDTTPSANRRADFPMSSRFRMRPQEEDGVNHRNEAAGYHSNMNAILRRSTEHAGPPLLNPISPCRGCPSPARTTPPSTVGITTTTVHTTIFASSSSISTIPKPHITPLMSTSISTSTCTSTSTSPWHPPSISPRTPPRSPRFESQLVRPVRSRTESVSVISHARMNSVGLTSGGSLGGGQTDRPRKVMVVEDNQINTMLLTKMLDRLKYTWDVYENGREAVDAIVNEGRQFDVIIMDIRMPVMDGIEAMQLIRQHYDDQHQRDVEETTEDGLDGDMFFDLEACEPVIIASTANLTSETHRYIDAGFDVSTPSR